MKKMWTKLFSPLLLAGMIVASGACSDDDKSGDPNGGNGGGPEPDEYVAYPKAACVYFGEDMAEGLGHYSLILYSEGVSLDESWYLEGTGDAIWIELISSLADDPRQAAMDAGTYAPVASMEEIAGFTFLTGEVDMPSFVASCTDGEETDDMIVDGSVKIEREGDAYTVKLSVQTESGVVKVCKYEGKIPIEVMGAAYGPDPFGGTFAAAQALYFGDFYEANTGNIQLVMTDIEEEGAVMGHTLYLDLNTTLFDSQAAITLAPGTYTCDKAQSFATPSTFNAGYEDGEYYNGSLWVETDSEGGEHVLMVTDGTLTVGRSGANYTIAVELELDNGQTRTGRYEGSVALSDESCLTRLDGDVSPVCTQGMAIFYGESQFYQNDSYNWTIRLASSGIDLERLTGRGEMMQLSINTSKAGTTEIPTGDYKVMESIHTDYLVPFTYIPGYIDNLRGLMGSWYTKDLVALGPCVDGTLRIENKGGGNYAIQFDFVDDYYYTPTPNKITGTYEGPLTYVDDSAFEAPAKAPARTGKPQTARQSKFRAERSAPAYRWEARR